MQNLSIGQPKEVVKLARLSVRESQQEFALRVASTQPLISRYERGLVSPPSQVLMHCMHILGVPISPLLSEADLVKLVKQRLGGDRMAPARLVLAQLIYTLSMEMDEPARSRKPTLSRESAPTR